MDCGLWTVDWRPDTANAAANHHVGSNSTVCVIEVASDNQGGSTHRVVGSSEDRRQQQYEPDEPDDPRFAE